MLTTEQKKEKLKELLYKVVSVDGNIFNVKCAKGHASSNTFFILHKKKGFCDKCGSSLYLDKIHIKQIQNAGLKYYKHEKDLFTLECKKGHFFKRTYNLLKYSNFICIRCKSKHISLDERIKDIKKYGSRLISKDRNSITIECKNGHQSVLFNYNIKNYKGKCEECKKQQ